MTARPTTRSPQREHRHEDRGAALILAIGFVVMIGAISAGLAGLVTSSVNNRVGLIRVRDRQYAADGALEQAVAAVRRSIDTNGAGCSLGATANGTNTATLNGVAIRVDWRNACGVTRIADGLLVSQQNVIFLACADSGAACTDAGAIITAQVNFERQASGPVTRTAVQSWSVNQ